MKKKIAALSMAACMAASVTACGGSKPAETTAAATEAETTAAESAAEESVWALWISPICTTWEDSP